MGSEIQFWLIKYEKKTLVIKFVYILLGGGCTKQSWWVKTNGVALLGKMAYSDAKWWENKTSWKFVINLRFLYKN